MGGSWIFFWCVGGARKIFSKIWKFPPAPPLEILYDHSLSWSCTYSRGMLSPHINNKNMSLVNFGIQSRHSAKMVFIQLIQQTPTMGKSERSHGNFIRLMATKFFYVGLFLSISICWFLLKIWLEFRQSFQFFHRFSPITGRHFDHCTWRKS